MAGSKLRPSFFVILVWVLKGLGPTLDTEPFRTSLPLEPLIQMFSVMCSNYYKTALPVSCCSKALHLRNFLGSWLHFFRPSRDLDESRRAGDQIKHSRLLSII